MVFGRRKAERERQPNNLKRKLKLKERRGFLGGGGAKLVIGLSCAPEEKEINEDVTRSRLNEMCNGKRAGGFQSLRTFTFNKFNQNT